MKGKLFFAILLAFCLRLIALNQSLWLDEAITANVIRNYSFIGIITHFSLTDFHPPLHYEILKLWSLVFGFSEVSLRFPSVAASLLTGIFVFLIGKKLKNETVGYWAALLYLVNPLAIYYSQEARMYSLVTLFLTIALYYFIKIIRHPEVLPKDLFCFSLFSALSVFTHYGSIFFLSSLFIYLILKKNYRILLRLIPGTIIAIIILFPLILQQFLYSKTMLVNVAHWSLVLGKADLKNLLLIPLKFTTGRISFYPKIIYLSLSSIIAIFVFSIALISSSKFLKYIFCLPLLLAFIVSFNSPMFQYFRFLYLIPILSLLLATSRHPETIKWVEGSIFVTASLVYLFFPQFHREDWKSLALALPKNTSVYLIPSFGDPLKYYRPDVIIKDIRQVDTSPAIIIPYGVEIYGLNHFQLLQKNGYHQQSTHDYRQIMQETWNK